MSTGVRTAVGKFVWHENKSTDVGKATRFYSQLLGWKIKTRTGETDYATIEMDGQKHGGFATAQGGAPSHWLGHVLVEDVDATAEHARGAGGNVLAGPFDIPEGGRMAVIADPDGAVLAAIASTDDAEAGEGTFVWDELLTSDVEVAKRFYGEVFGWTTRDVNLGDRGTYSIFQYAGTANIGGCMRLDDVQAPPHWLVHISTEDVDAAVARAQELGATALMEGKDIPNVGRIAVLKDPVGAIFCLYM